MSKLRDAKRLVQELPQLCNSVADDPSIPPEKKAHIVIHLGSIVCAAVAVQPIPFADIVILTPIQVAMVAALNRVMGGALAKTKLTEVVVYTVGVVGWGLLAQQSIIGLYKLGLPGAGGFATIPLVYAATAGIGYAASAVLQARIKDQTITKEEIRRIRDEAAAKAQKRAEKEGLDTKSELKQWRDKAREFAAYKKLAEELSSELSALKRDFQNTAKKDGVYLSDEEMSAWLAADEKQKEDLLNKTQEIEKLRTLAAAIERSAEKKSKAIRSRFTSLYPSVQLSDHAHKRLAHLPDAVLLAFEAQLQRMQNQPQKVSYRDTVHGTKIREIGFAGDQRAYIDDSGSTVKVVRVGSKGTQKLDTEWLRKQYKA